MKILVFIGTNRFIEKINISKICIQKILKNKSDSFKVCLTDKNIELVKFLEKNNISFVSFNKLEKFIQDVTPNQYDWLLNLWGHKIFNKDFLKKFKNNLNLHPSYLPYGKGKDPVIWSIINEFPAGIAIHKMTNRLDSGAIYIKKKINKKPFIKGKELYLLTLKEIAILFCKNWEKIRTQKIKPILSNKNNRIYNRKNLIEENIINLSLSKNKKYLKFLNKIQAFDFDPQLNYKIKFKNKIYKTKLSIDE